MSTEAAVPTGQSGFLGRIERIGNKIPHPAIIFLGLILIVIVLSQILFMFGVKVTTEVAEPVGTTVTATCRIRGDRWYHDFAIASDSSSAGRGEPQRFAEVWRRVE